MCEYTRIKGSKRERERKREKEREKKKERTGRMRAKQEVGGFVPQEQNDHTPPREK